MYKKGYEALHVSHVATDRTKLLYRTDIPLEQTARRAAVRSAAFTKGKT